MINLTTIRGIFPCPMKTNVFFERSTKSSNPLRTKKERVKMNREYALDILAKWERTNKRKSEFAEEVQIEAKTLDNLIRQKRNGKL